MFRLVYSSRSRIDTADRSTELGDIFTFARRNNRRLGVTGKAVLIDVTLDDKLAKSVRNIPGVTMVPSSRVTARDVMNAGRVVVTRGALEKLQEALG